MSKVPWLFWGVFFGGQFVYFFVLATMELERQAPLPLDLRNKLLIALVLIAGIVLWFAVVIPRWLARATISRLPGGLELRAPSGENALWQSVFVPFVVRLVLLEVVCIVGFVAAFVSHDYRMMLPFLGVSCLGYFRATPTKDHLEELLRA